MQQADRDRLHTVGPKVVDDRREAGELERLALAAVVRHPSGQLAAQVAGNERWRLDVVEVEEVRPVAAGDLERVAETRGGDQPGLHALALRQGVDDDGRAVGEERDLLDPHTAGRKHLEHASLEVGRRRLDLGCEDLLASRRGIGEK